MALRVILAEAEMELIPKEIMSHGAVEAHARNLNRAPTSLLLDQNHHHAAMRRLPNKERRGRPDIIHTTLLHLLESPLCRAGGLQICVHTRHRELIRFRPETRLPRGEARFQGVIARVLRKGASQDQDPLIWSEGKKSAEQVLESFAAGPVFRLDENGTSASPLQLVDQAKGGELTVIIGGFPHGDWGGEWSKAAPKTISIWPDALNAWVVASEIAVSFRARHGPHRPR